MASNGLPAGVSESEHFSPYRSDGKLYGFVCVVIGAAHPIGRAITLELAAHGAACIYACTLPSDSASKTATNESSSYPNTRITHYPYAPTEEATLQLVDDVLNTHGRLDVWVTLATSLGPAKLSSTTPASLSALFEATALVPFYALKYGPPAMRKSCSKGGYPNAAPKDTEYGSIIVVGSVASEYGGCGGVGHTMASHAALGVVRSGVKELKGTGVRINAISHGCVEEDGSDSDLKGLAESSGLGRPGKAMEVARVAGFLASGFSSYVTGSNMVVDGGARVMNPVTVPLR
ncbi:NAD(P)-binding protein [Myriangium duriaei CBS 260.36]|uniref:Peroxisomal trans-2-enoyl-CoA reductase n=1 Tax=Myriangium duriaei CBS 260.36 TaxID=1168546 RepID=A0A9P4IW05_9PEZI|nr:NAD(P)-binding protein [Myriangium duriaei CBS 260.36]